MREYNNFSHYCQYKSNNYSVIIIPSVFYTNQLLSTHNLISKHIVVLCHFLLSCWREQPHWLGEERPTLDSMLKRPLKAKMIELDYTCMSKVLSLTKIQLKSVIIDLEQAKLLRRVLIKNQWYVLLSDQAFKLYLNSNKSKKHRINKGNIIPTSWLSAFKTDNGQTDFNGALILGEITYFSRVLKRKQQIDDHFEKAEAESLSASSVRHNSLPDDEDAECFDDEAKQGSADDIKLVSKSKGLVAYFEHDHFRKKFPFLSSKVVDRTLSRLEKNNIISVECKKFIRGRKVIKRLYITLNYDLIQKGVNNTIVDFIFKTDNYLTNKQLTDFCQNTPPSIYNIYNNKTIIYPCRGFLSNFVSFFSLSSSDCFTTSNLTKSPEQIISKKWYQVTYPSYSNSIEQHNKYEKYAEHQKTDQINSTESYRSKRRAFKIPRYLSEMHSSLKRLYKAYFAVFDYPLSFCYFLLDSLAKKYPDANFQGENQFITYFRKILSQEKRASWQVRSRKYFDQAKSLADLAYEKLPNTLREKLNKIAEHAGKKIEELPALLSRLAARNAKHLFSCLNSFLSYMKQVLLKLKSKEEIQEAYKALPRANITEVASYLNAVEASYHRTGPQEHLRRKLASTLPMTVAYHLLNNCNFYGVKIDNERNFIIPSKNKNWAEMIRGGIKEIIKNQIAAVYGQIKEIKFVQFLRREDTDNKIKASAFFEVSTKAETLSKCFDAHNAYYQDDENKQRTNNINKCRVELSLYELFHKQRLESELKEQEELKAKMAREEKELQASNGDLKLYENYKQVIKQAEIEKQRYIKRVGDRESARKLYKMLSFAEWMQLQELIRMI